MNRVVILTIVAGEIMCAVIRTTNKNKEDLFNQSVQE
jgi:hypothetical protein